MRPPFLLSVSGIWPEKICQKAALGLHPETHQEIHSIGSVLKGILADVPGNVRNAFAGELAEKEKR